MRIIDVRRHEWAPLGWAAAWFFCVLASYYAIRPVRDAYGVNAGSNGLSWLFTATLAVTIAAAPIYSFVTTIVARRWLPMVVYGFFASNLAAFWLGLETLNADDQTWLRWTFYVWVTVFNVYAVTVFWSFAVDRFSTDQAKRLFGLAAGAGTLGGLAGSEAARWTVRLAGVEEVLWLSAGLMIAAIGCAWRFCLATPEGEPSVEPAAKPRAAKAGDNLRDAAAGLAAVMRSPYLAGIAALMVLSSIAATTIYMEISDVVRKEIASESARTDWYAKLNNYQNLFTLVGQALGASWLIRRCGLGVTLVIVPAVYAIGYAVFAIHPTLVLLGAFDVAQRVASFAVGVPAREVLFTTVSPDEKYAAKALIDTVGKRTGDAIAAHGYAALRALHWTPAVISLAMLPLTAVIAGFSVALGRQHGRQAKSVEAESRDR